MVMKHKKIIIPFITFFICLALFINAFDNKKAISPGLVAHFDLNNKTVNELTTQNELLSWLDNEEKAVWRELEKAINLSLDQCQNLKKTNISDYEDDLILVKDEYVAKETLSSETISSIQSIMKECGISPSQLSIIPCNHGSAAAATDKFILVDQKAFNKLTLNGKKFAIGHELVHFLKKDHSTNFFVRKFAGKHNLNKNDSNNPINKLFQLQELRADILSSLHGDDYAQGSIIFFNDHILAQGALSGPPCHPTSSLRLKLGTKIAGMLHSDTQKA